MRKELELPEWLDQPPLAIAHRGGALLPENLGKENTLEAFANAVNLGYNYLETDLRTTSDGQVFAFHDADLRRVLGRNVRFEQLRADEVRALRLADGARIVTLDDLLVEFPDAVFNIDFKDEGGIAPALESIRHRDAAERVIIASFSHTRLTRVRADAPHLVTSASQLEVLRFRLGGEIHAGGSVALQIPEKHLGLRVLTPALVRRAHDRGMHVHVWTIDNAATMHRLLDAGVDGIVTDRPDVLRQVLHERGDWAM